MRIQDLEAMDFDALWGLHEKLTKVLAEKITAEKFELEKRLALLTRSNIRDGLSGFGAEADVVPGSGRRYPKVKPKYRNPSPPYETWSGRGKQPRWLTEALRSGHEIEEFRIDIDFQTRDREGSGGLNS